MQQLMQFRIEKKNKTNEFIFQKKWINEFNVGIYGSYLMIFNYFKKCQI